MATKPLNQKKKHVLQFNFFRVDISLICIIISNLTLVSLKILFIPHYNNVPVYLNGPVKSEALQNALLLSIVSSSFQGLEDVSCFEGITMYCTIFHFNLAPYSCVLDSLCWHNLSNLFMRSFYSQITYSKGRFHHIVCQRVKLLNQINKTCRPVWHLIPRFHRQSIKTKNCVS